jgi:hypothetical protein
MAELTMPEEPSLRVGSLLVMVIRCSQKPDGTGAVIADVTNPVAANNRRVWPRLKVEI